MALGPVMLDIAGTALSAEDRELLVHPAVGGVILFTRNYADPVQLAALVREIHGVREPHLLVAVDHEGGRVQRFRDGFTPLPALARYGERYARSAQEALCLVETGGWLLAAELRSCGVDLSFAPVLDLRTGRSSVIGERAFHRDPEVVASLARAMMRGMRDAGMAAVGKHFPGHGSVEEDSHVAVPVDRRGLDALRLTDMLAFERMFHYGLPAVMPAHVVFPAVDALPVGFSRVWIDGVLRGELGFDGAVFSDDLCMAGAAAAGDLPARARLALDAGCDVLLLCNDRSAALRVVEHVGVPAAAPLRAARLLRLHGRGPALGLAALAGTARHTAAVHALAALTGTPELGLDTDEGVA